MLNLEQIKERHAKATKGPWLLASGDDEFCSSIFGVISEAENQRVEADTRIFRGDFPEDTKWIAVDAGVSPARLADEDNFDFIANSWQDVKDLIEEVERLRRRVELRDLKLEAARKGLEWYAAPRYMDAGNATIQTLDIGQVARQVLEALAIEERPTAIASPSQGEGK